MDLAELRRNLSLIIDAREHRVEVGRDITEPDGTIVGRIYRGSFYSLASRTTKRETDND